MTELEKFIGKVYDKLKSGEYHINTLEQSVPEMPEKSKAYLNYLENTEGDIDKDILMKFVIIQLDYYTFSDSGEVFISDSDYDLATRMLRFFKMDVPTTNTFEPNTTAWPIKKHSAPQMVGSVTKVFSLDDVSKFIESECNSTYGSTGIIFAPKYDGVGVCLEYDPKKVEIVSALTRKDGTSGQELIQLIRKCKNYDDVLYHATQEFGMNKGYIKCEIVMSENDFEELIKEKPYKNRRNGTSGIINTPSNIEYAKYLTIIPLVYGVQKSKKLSYTYMPANSITTTATEIARMPDLVEEYINMILESTHNSTFEYRTDGVVIFIDNLHMQYPNVMSHAIAFKTNSKVATTTILYGYISIGRTGKATPMIKVEPCDLNETVVTDISLSNFHKVKLLDLHDHDKILVESSGDVIPMVKEVIKRGGVMQLEFGNKCPICGSVLAPYVAGTGTTEYECINPSCPRLISGKVTNFLEKLGANGISDQTILNIYESLEIKDIVDFLDIDKYKDRLINLPAWGATSANNFCNEIKRIRSKPITHGEFLGAMGIPGISTKKCKALFAEVDYDHFMKLCHEGKYDRADADLYEVKGFSCKTIDTFMEFIKSNMTTIDKLSKMLTLTKDKRAGANIVFTGFRDKEIEEYVGSKGVDVSDNINGQTIAVITANKGSGKTKKAIERNIPIFDAYSAPLTEVCDYIIANLM